MELEKILKEMGFSDEQVKSFLNAMKENKLYVTEQENPEEEIRKLKEENEALKGENDILKQNTDGASGAEEENKKLQETISRVKKESALIIALTKANAVDVDYLLYKAEKSGAYENLTEDENGHVTGAEELVNGLKTSYAAQFEEAKDPVSALPANVKKLDTGNNGEAVPQTLEEAIIQKLSGEEE